MNFFKAVISSAAASLSDFKYDYNPNTAIGPLGVFHFCQGTAKGSAEPVSILYCDKKKGASEEDVDAAKRAAKKFKTLRHPSVVKVLATSESDYSVYIAIERCRVLTEVLDEIRGGSTEHSKDSLYWGMRKMSDLLTFLSSASIIHANLLPDFIFVDRAGEWKLGGLEFVCEAAAYPTSFIRSRVNAACIPPECRDGRQSGSCDSTNAWLLGCLMYSAFAGEISDEKDVVNVGRMPREWQAAYKRIIASPPSRRMGPKELQSERLIANNEFISAMVFLDEFELHDGDEREEFMSHLPDKIGGMFAADVCIYRLLPRLLELSHISITGIGSQQGRGRGQAKGQEKDKQGSVGRFLAPLLKIGNLFMNADEFQQKISPVVVTAFASPDEKVKASLFANLGQFVEYLSDTVISKEVLPHVVSAMESNNAELKQMVLRALPSITPKLKESQVDGPLLKALGRCLNDQDARLRTNATVSLAMIGPSLPQKLQEKILVPSFTKRLRDPFPPARGAALRSLVANAAHLKPADLAKMALPAVVVLTVDAVEDVRQEALLCARTLLDHIAAMSLQAGEDKSGEKGKEEVGGGGVGGSGGGAKSSKTEVMKWALSGMGTWATKLLEKTGKGSASTSSDEKGRYSVLSYLHSRHPLFISLFAYTRSATSSGHNSAPRRSMLLPSTPLRSTPLSHLCTPPSLQVQVTMQRWKRRARARKKKRRRRRSTCPRPPLPHPPACLQ
uniref:Protein kinase domain-containing protein n=1 Tax=Palpitomonas bilix TaxID=652834 RepID=A0A7S3DDJ8_9EUKA|mmetsp:Transcript_30748/g.80422  ORF Transcript_30748/g.80422 Transcript_30748/m.80422 type:complete len:730 (+) Transcript_30748:130-2319(+)